MRLRLYHAPDGARVAYREAGTGPGLVLLHSALFTHRELEPVVEHLVHRFRVVLPDLPLHGDSEDRPRHPYTLDWLADVLAGFCVEVAGPRPLVGGHGLGAEVLLRAVETGRLEPARMVLLPNRLHRPDERSLVTTTWRGAARVGALPGLDRLVPKAARVAFRPRGGRAPQRAVGPGRARPRPPRRRRRRRATPTWGAPGRAFARRWPRGPRRELLDAYPAMRFPVLLLWADADRLHPLQGAEEALDLLPDGQLRVLPRTGFLMAYDDAVGVGRELVAFCG